MDTKNNITKATKLVSLQWLCEIISDHLQSGTESHWCLLFYDPISDKIISDIDVSCLIATWLFTIIFQFDGDMVIDK